MQFQLLTQPAPAGPLSKTDLMNRLTAFLLCFLAGITGAMAQTEVTIRDNDNGTTESIDLPEGMTLNTDALLKEWNAKKYLYPDTTCENPDYNPTFEPEVYKERLRRIPAVVELPYNNVVQGFIDQYSGRLRRSVSYMLGACNFYIPIFEEALDYYGVPLELKYLPVIESALSPTAVSRAGAVGLWQFMLPTAKRYGLEVNSLVDERCDPLKSSYAAAHYLSDLYKIYGDWNLVIAAYNCGPTNINKAIHRAGGTKDYWAIYHYLPKETRGYVPAFIAANYIMNYYCEHNICPMKATYPMATDTLLLTRDVHFEQVAELCKVDMDALRALNPQYRTAIVPGSVEPSVLRLPLEAATAFIDLGDSIYTHRAGELFTRRAEVEVKAPQAKRTAGKASRKSSSSRRSKSSRPRHVTIRKGDTLIDIAKRNGTTVSKLRKLNNLKGNSIRAGKTIRVR